jgi:hypothetical protein
MTKRKQINSIASKNKIIRHTKLIKNNGASPLDGLDFSSLDLLVMVPLVVFSEFDAHEVLTRLLAGDDLDSTD